MSIHDSYYFKITSSLSLDMCNIIIYYYQWWTENVRARHSRFNDNFISQMKWLHLEGERFKTCGTWWKLWRCRGDMRTPCSGEITDIWTEKWCTLTQLYKRSKCGKLWHKTLPQGRFHNPQAATLHLRNTCTGLH